MKIYKGRKRIAKKKLDKYDWKWINFFAQLKVGDWIHTCEGFNRRIESIEYDWARIGPKTSVIYDIVFTDSNNRCHFVSGAGCVFPKVSNQEIIDYWMDNWLNTEDSWGFADYAKRMKEALDKGLPVLSENGEPLINPDTKQLARNPTTEESNGS